MNDTTYLASILDAHRAAQLRRDVEILNLRAERDEDDAAAGADPDAAATRVAASVSRRRMRRAHRSVRRSALTTR